jgi:hypothetical protein
MENLHYIKQTVKQLGWTAQDLVGADQSTSSGLSVMT